MKPKAIIKLAVDVLMILELLFLMGYHFWGEILHEWVGAGMFLLFIAHHILNGHWYKTLFKGKYNALRIVTLLIDFLVLVSMLAQMYSGILLFLNVMRYIFMKYTKNSKRISLRDIPRENRYTICLYQPELVSAQYTVGLRLLLVLFR